MKPDLAAALAEIDGSFAATGNPLEALGAVALAAKTATPIPPTIAEWLRAGIEAFKADQSVTLDAALGLNAVGPENPRRQRRAKDGLQGDLGRVYVLHMLGATIDEAASMVERVSPEMLKASTISDRFRRSGLGKEARAERAAAIARYHWTEIEAILAEYPDHGIPVAEAKKSIRAMYAKHGV